MIRSLLVLFATVALLGLIASFQVFASPEYGEPPYNTTTYTPVPDPAESAVHDAMQAHVAAAMAEQTAMAQRNAAAAAGQPGTGTGMTGTQDFILKLTAIVMPLLIAMMTGLMLYIQIKQKQAGDLRGVQHREDLILVARSVNGVKTELVAKAELAAFLEGVQIEAQGKMSEMAEARLAELKEAVRLATEKAETTANKTIKELVEKQQQCSPNHPTTPGAP